MCKGIVHAAELKETKLISNHGVQAVQIVELSPWSSSEKYPIDNG
jgi:hypothetical protein